MRWARFSGLGDWPQRQAAGVAIAILAYGCLTAAMTPFLDYAEIIDVALLYLLLTLVVAAIWGYWIGLLGAVLADLLVNFFFVPPVHEFTVQEPANVAALFIFLTVAFVGASMLALLRRQVQIAEARQAETAVLLGLSREVSHAVSPQDALNALCRAVVVSLKARSCAIVQQRGHVWEVVGASGGSTALSRDEEAVAGEAVRTGSVGRLGATARLLRNHGGDRFEAVTTFVPLGEGSPTRGVLRIRGAITVPPMADRDALLSAFADEATTALHRAILAGEAQRVEALKRADEFKSVLLSSVSHDLRSPLTAIKAAAGSLRDESVLWSDDDRRSFLSTIDSQTDRLAGTVNNILEMSRLEGGAVRPTFEPIEIEPLLRELVEATRPVTAGRNVDLHAEPDLWITADYGLVVQALQNLVENAAKYSTPGGAIRLDASRAVPHVFLTVSDEGPGIGADDLPHIFEKFYRGTSTREAKGSGLGLSIVKAMVELCGGAIDVATGESGTRFTLRLRATRPPLN